uniref:Secreted protein n=1 Tax=Oryza barthii TaxID=65489 RepID=A0A0D3HS96_9ORYZ
MYNAWLWLIVSRLYVGHAHPWQQGPWLRRPIPRLQRNRSKRRTWAQEGRSHSSRPRIGRAGAPCVASSNRQIRRHCCSPLPTLAKKGGGEEPLPLREGERNCRHCGPRRQIWRARRRQARHAVGELVCAVVGGGGRRRQARIRIR